MIRVVMLRIKEPLVFPRLTHPFLSIYSPHFTLESCPSNIQLCPTPYKQHLIMKSCLGQRLPSKYPMGNPVSLCYLLFKTSNVFSIHSEHFILSLYCDDKDKEINADFHIEENCSFFLYFLNC
jgi:hypothetical protein